MNLPLLTVQIHHEHDVVMCRQRARIIAEHLGLDRQDQVRIATAVSELARNVFQYAGRGKVEFGFDDKKNVLRIVASDKGPGITDLKKILEGNYVSETGMGLGLVGARKLADHFEIESSPEGTTVQLEKVVRSPLLPGRAKMDDLMRQLGVDANQSPMAEMQMQNQELLAALDELEKSKQELAQLNQELGDTNRGVLALYAELDEKAEDLRRVSEIKTRFLSNMTHEFRTPLNSILGLSRLLLDRVDGELNPEQEKQVSFIRRAATDLSELVNDLLDISKVEAGKIEVHAAPFELVELFGALRGMLRPLLTPSSPVNLIFENPGKGFPTLFTDETKLSQILRNFISNALKYTEKGEVVVRGEVEDQQVVISVSDSGIGIAPEDLDRIFEEFTQIEGPHQKKAKGTGLGLSLSKKLAELLGGQVRVCSTPGRGSTFSVLLPMAENAGIADQPSRAHGEGDTASPVPRIERILIVDDDQVSRYLFRSLLNESGYEVIEANGGHDGLRAAREEKPSVVFLDLAMPDLDGFEFLRRAEQDAELKDIPVVIYSTKTPGAEQLKRFEKSVAGVLAKDHSSREEPREQINSIIQKILDSRKEGAR